MAILHAMWSEIREPLLHSGDEVMLNWDDGLGKLVSDPKVTHIQPLFSYTHILLPLCGTGQFTPENRRLFEDLVASKSKEGFRLVSHPLVQAKDDAGNDIMALYVTFEEFYAAWGKSNESVKQELFK
jgi:hypothetical protein